ESRDPEPIRTVKLRQPQAEQNDRAGKRQNDAINRHGNRLRLWEAIRARGSMSRSVDSVANENANGRRQQPDAAADAQHAILDRPAAAEQPLKGRRKATPATQPKNQDSQIQHHPVHRSATEY